MKFLYWLTVGALAMPFHGSAQTAAFEGFEVNVSSGWVPLRISSTFEKGLRKQTRLERILSQ